MSVEWNTIGIVASIIVAAVSCGVYIQRGFRNLEASFYKALDLHKKEDSDKFQAQALRIQRLELKEFGFTKSEPF